MCSHNRRIERLARASEASSNNEHESTESKCKNASEASLKVDELRRGKFAFTVYLDLNPIDEQSEV